MESHSIRSGSNSWPWKLIVQALDEKPQNDADEKPESIAKEVPQKDYTYKPKSDVLWWKRGFPRLLVEIFFGRREAR